MLMQWAPKATEFGGKCKIKAITPFKVIPGHRFWYQSKAHMQLLLVINTNFPPILHRWPFPNYGWLLVIKNCR